MARRVLALTLGALGGLLGYLGFVLLLERGFYALVLPGGLFGLSAGIVKTRGVFVACLSTIMAIVAGLIAEHRFAPFTADASLLYFLLHAASLRPVTLAIVGLGGLIGFWVPFRRRL
jgi:hypothetical protein